MALDGANLNPNGLQGRHDFAPDSHSWRESWRESWRRRWRGPWALDILFGWRGGGDSAAAASYAGVASSANGPEAAFAGAVLGCLATLYLSEFGFPPAIASALATVMLCGPLLLARATRRFPGEFYSAVYGGSFSGMTPMPWTSSSASVVTGLPVSIPFLSLALVCGLAFALVAEFELRTGRPLARGYGGRSGAIATTASLLFVALAPLFGGDDSLFRAARPAAFDGDSGLITRTYVACSVGMYATLLVLRLPRLMEARTADRTFTAAALALAGLLFLPLHDLMDANAFYAGCFLGMSTPERLKGPLLPVLGGIVLTALLIYERGILGGIGGSLGLAAFVTVLVLAALSRMLTAAITAIRLPTILSLAAASRGLLPRLDGSETLLPEPRLPIPATIPARRLRMTFAPIAATLVIGGLLAPVGLVPRGSDPTVVTALPARQPEPVSQRPALMPDVAGAADATLAFVNVAPDSIAPSAAAVGPMAPRVAAQEPAMATVPVAGSFDPSDKLFREYLKWRASHAVGRPATRPVPLRNGNRAAVQLIIPVAPGVPRPVPVRRPIRPAGAVAATRPVATQPAPRPENLSAASAR